MSEAPHPNIHPFPRQAPARARPGNDPHHPGPDPPPDYAPPQPPDEQPAEAPPDWEPEPPPEPPPGPFDTDEIRAARAHRTLHTRPIAAIQPKPIGWLWPRWLPHGFCWLEGDPGVNKSMLAVYLSALVTAGQPFPGESASRSPGSVLYLTSGEDPDEVIRERFLRAGGDPRRMFLLDARQIMTDPAVPEPARGLPVLPEDAGRIMDTAHSLGASLVVLDAAYSFVSTKHDISSDHSLRAALEPFARTIADAGMVALGLRHLTKVRQQAQHSGIGAVAGTAVARSVLVLNRDPHRSDVRLLGCTKLSYGAPHTGSLAFEIEAEGPTGAAWVAYSGESDISARRATRLARDDRAAEGERLYAKIHGAFETAFEQNERIPVRGPQEELNVDSLAVQAGYAPGADFPRSRLARRLKQALRIRIEQIKEGRTPRWFWTRTTVP